MPWHIAPQLAVEWSTGARVSSVLMGCRLCDLSLAEGREQITFIETKNGQPVTASLHPWTTEKVRAYLERRGRLDDREGPIFLDHRGRPYGSGAKGSRGRNKTGFRNGRAKAVKALIKAGRHQDAGLLAQVTQHWLRHWFATHTLKLTGDVRLVMDQGGWLDVRSVMRYAHDVPSVRRRAINALPIGTTLTQEQPKNRKSGSNSGD
jgi:site-specific recombinase XerD